MKNEINYDDEMLETDEQIKNQKIGRRKQFIKIFFTFFVFVMVTLNLGNWILKWIIWQMKK